MNISQLPRDSPTLTNSLSLSVSFFTSSLIHVKTSSAATIRAQSPHCVSHAERRRKGGSEGRKEGEKEERGTLGVLTMKYLFGSLLFSFIYLFLGILKRLLHITSLLRLRFAAARGSVAVIGCSERSCPSVTSSEKLIAQMEVGGGEEGSISPAPPPHQPQKMDRVTTRQINVRQDKGTDSCWLLRYWSMKSGEIIDFRNEMSYCFLMPRREAATSCWGSQSVWRRGISSLLVCL